MYSYFDIAEFIIRLCTRNDHKQGLTKAFGIPVQ